MTRNEKAIAALLKEAPFMTALEAADTIGVSVSHVYGTAQKFGLPYKRRYPVPTNDQRARAIRLARDGLPDEAIARRLGLMLHTIERIRLAEGVAHRGAAINPQASKEQLRRMARMFLIEGYTVREICKKLGVTRGSVTGAVYRARRQKTAPSARVKEKAEAG